MAPSEEAKASTEVGQAVLVEAAASTAELAEAAASEMHDLFGAITGHEGDVRMAEGTHDTHASSQVPHLSLLPLPPCNSASNVNHESQDGAHHSMDSTFFCHDESSRLPQHQAGHRMAIACLRPRMTNPARMKKKKTKKETKKQERQGQEDKNDKNNNDKHHKDKVSRTRRIKRTKKTNARIHHKCMANPLPPSLCRRGHQAKAKAAMRKAKAPVDEQSHPVTRDMGVTWRCQHSTVTQHHHPHQQLWQSVDTVEDLGGD